MARECGAKTRSGAPCLNKAMPNGRCRMHGGTSTGAPKGAQNAKRPGSIYSRLYTADEQAMESEIELGSIDAELRLMRVRLTRLLGAETNVPELEEVIEREGAENATARHEEKFKRRDYSGQIDRTVGRIESLERRRLELQIMQRDIAKADQESGVGAHEVVGFEMTPYEGDADQDGEHPPG